MPVEETMKLKELYNKIPQQYRWAAYSAIGTYLGTQYGPFAKAVFTCAVKQAGLN